VSRPVRVLLPIVDFEVTHPARVVMPQWIHF